MTPITDDENTINSTNFTTTTTLSPTINYPLYLKHWDSTGMEYYKYGIFSLIILFSFFGNSLVVITISMTTRLKNVTNYFLFNMAVADILVTVIVMPIHLIYWFDQSIMLGQLTCKATPFLQGMSVCCTIYTLTVIAIDRYKVILVPLGGRIRKNQCLMIIFSIWCASVITVSPSLFVYRVGVDEVYNNTRCDEYGWSNRNKIEFTYTLMVLTYFLPLFLFFFVYGKIFICLWFREIPGIKDMPPCVQQRMKKKCLRRKKLVRMLVAVVVTFMLCHLPQNTINFLWYSGNAIGWEAPMFMEIVAFHAEIALYLNAAINPLVYGFLHGRIKNASYALLRWAFCCAKRHGFSNSYLPATKATMASDTYSMVKYKHSLVDRQPCASVRENKQSRALLHENKENADNLINNEVHSM